MRELVSPIALVTFLTSIYLGTLIGILLISVIKVRFRILFGSIPIFSLLIVLLLMNSRDELPAIKDFYYFYYVIMTLLFVVLIVFLTRSVMVQNIFGRSPVISEIIVALFIAIVFPRIYLPYYLSELQESLQNSMSQSMVSKSIKVCNQLLKYYPGRNDLIKLQADLQQMENELILEFKQPNVSTSLRRAGVFAQLGKFDSAMDELGNLNDMNPDYYLLKGSILFQQKKYWESIQQYKSGLKLLNSLADSSKKTRLLQRRCLSAISFCELNINNYSGAIEARLAISMIDPDNSMEDQFEIAAIYYQAGDTATALEQLLRIRSSLTPVLRMKADSIINKIRLENNSCLLRPR